MTTCISFTPRKSNSPTPRRVLIECARGRDVERSRPSISSGPRPVLPLEHRPVIVGAGPAGLFAGYLLALDGYRPIILERGREVKDRVADVLAFDAGGPVDPESNYLFGEGGAGTFSDGKLTSRNSGPDVLASSKSWPIATVSRRSTSNGRIWARIGCR